MTCSRIPVKLLIPNANEGRFNGDTPLWVCPILIERGEFPQLKGGKIMATTTSAKVDSRGRLIIPREMRDQLGIEAGDTVFVALDREIGQLRVAKAEDPFDVLARAAVEESKAGPT